MPEKTSLQSEIQTPFSFSQSSLQDYIDCARRFQLRYIEQLKWPAIETDPVLENERRQIEGQQFHRMLQQFMLGLPADKLARLATSENLARWWENFITARLSELSDMADSSLYPEVTLSAPFGKHRIMAKYDLIAVKDGKATIYDWKTYHKRPRDERMAARPQTRVYQALLVVAGAHLNGGLSFDPARIEMLYWYADFPGKPARFPYKAAFYKRDTEWMKNLVSEISSKQSYPLTDDNEKCGYCPYRSYCERGVQASNDDDFESEPGLENISLEQIQEIEF
jgi:CRISPR/Cas system-associated exonuclease Cas4 (RecB family)